MFLGHFAVAMAAKKAAPRPSLGTLVMAALFADGLWPVFLLLGWEEVKIAPGITAVTPLDFVSYPWSHSMAFDLIWAALFAAVYFLMRRDGRGAAWLALLVLSHWVLDWVAHRPDMPLWPGSLRVGLGLWYSMPATLVVELVMFALGVWIYASITRARDRVGVYSLWGFIVLLAILYFAAVFGPPPPSVTALAISALAGWLFVAWCYWIDRHREAVPLS